MITTSDAEDTLTNEDVAQMQEFEALIRQVGCDVARIAVEPVLSQALDSWRSDIKSALDALQELNRKLERIDNVSSKQVQAVDAALNGLGGASRLIASTANDLTNTTRELRGLCEAVRQQLVSMTQAATALDRSVRTLLESAALTKSCSPSLEAELHAVREELAVLPSRFTALDTLIRGHISDLAAYHDTTESAISRVEDRAAKAERSYQELLDHLKGQSSKVSWFLWVAILAFLFGFSLATTMWKWGA